MDPLSITASAIALGTLIQATLVSLNSLARDCKTFLKELEPLGAELQSLSLVINSLEKCVEGKSTLAAPLDDKHLINALNACHPTLKAIKVKFKEIRRSASQGSINKLMVGLFWSSTRTELQEMRSCLESHKTTLLLSLQLKSLELHLLSTDQKGKEGQKGILNHSSTAEQLDFIPQDQSQDQEWKNVAWKEDEKWNDDQRWETHETSNDDETWKDDKWEDEWWNDRRWKEEKWKGSGKWNNEKWEKGWGNEEWKMESAQPKAGRKSPTKTRPEDKDGQNRTEAGGWSPARVDLSTD